MEDLSRILPDTFLDGNISLANISDLMKQGPLRSELNVTHDDCKSKCNGTWRLISVRHDRDELSAGICESTNKTHCPLFFDSMMCRLPTSANETHAVDCSTIPLYEKSKHTMLHRCLPNATWEKGWNHSRAPDNPHVTDITREAGLACETGLGHVLVENNSIEIFMYVFASICSFLAW